MKTTVPTLSKTPPAELLVEDAIRLRAYELYAKRGMTDGNAVHDWLAAESELSHRHSSAAANLNQKSKH